jgi:hypothetical protein
MKSIGTGIVLAVGLLFAAAIHTFAIEGLQISVQCSNVVLSWPSAEGETYIVQYRKTLDPSDSWQTLTSSLPAVSGTNVTSFVHLNIVQNPCGCGGSAFAAMASGRNTLALAAAEPIAPAPMAIPADGSGGAVPLALYPPGFDLSGFLIFDPLTGESVSGSGYSASALALDSLQFDGPQPLDGGGGSGNSTPAPETGFYQVVRDGVYLLNSSLAKLTNGAVSNTVTVAFEAGNAASDGTGTNILGNLACAALIIDGGKFAGDGGVVGFPLSPFFMDTAYLENGNHSLQVEVTWLNPDNSDGNHVNITRRSNPVTITVSNQIYYPQWEPEVGEAGISAYFLKTIFTNVDWKIDIYDVSNKLAQTITNHTDDGTIEAYWNLVDTNGVTRTNADVDPVFSAIVTVYDAPISKPTPGKKQRQKNWPDHAVWTMAYQDFFKFEYSANNLMQYAINAFTLTAGKYGGYWIYYPQPGQTNDYGQTYPMRYQKTVLPTF